ncbi:MAG: transglutaminase domain-containing protein [Syntrophomonadaceae bacterium]|nr:transglutaminase domain-containing protein [Syntrophomonadaceae bacterium]
MKIHNVVAVRRIAVVLIVALLGAFIMPAAAPADNGDGDLTIPQQRAEALNQLGLFQGTDNGFELGRAPTRIEALIMLIRLLGQEDVALGGSFTHPFTDVPAWADAYAGYAWENGLTKGVSDTLLDASSPSGGEQYMTFVLRALGYSDAEGDFSWDNPYKLAADVGLLSSPVYYNNFLRADVAVISYDALQACFKGSEQMLAEKLIEQGVFSAGQFTAATGMVVLSPPSVEPPPGAETTEGTAAEASTNNVMWMEYLSYRVNSADELKEAWLDAVPRMPREIVFTVPMGETAHYVGLLEQYSFLVLAWSNGLEMKYGGDKVIVNPVYTHGGEVGAALELKNYPSGYPADEFVKELASAALDIYEKVITPGMSEYEQVKAIHDYIINNTDYDQGFTSGSDDVEGVLLYGKATCSGYAYTFQLLMSLCGIDCMVVGGSGTNNGRTENHAWNKVRIDGDWYNIDVTWDDPVVRGSANSSVLIYDFFLLSDSKFSRNHTWDPEDFPPCDKDWF